MKIIGVEWHSLGATYAGTVGIVLVKDEFEGYKAYMGVTRLGSMDEEADAKFIADWGSSISLEDACAWYPIWRVLIQNDGHAK